MTIQEATLADIPSIRSIAHQTWPVAYGSYISKSQLDYMLELMYSNEALSAQLQSGHRFFLAENESRQPTGFASFSKLPAVKEEPSRYKIHKIYVLPDQQGSGIGKQLIRHLSDLTLFHEPVWLELNVNRNNPAIHFYKKLGFEKIREEDIDIGNGFFMNDYVMRKVLLP